MNVKAWTWRILLLIELAIFTGITKSCAQTALKFDLDYTRIPVNNYDIPITDTLRVLLVLEKNSIGIVTIYDTLALDYTGRWEQFLMFEDIHHSERQEYTIERHTYKDKFLWIVTPIRPYPNRKLYSLILESL